MIAVIAKLNVVLGKEAEFERAMLNLGYQVRKHEDGNKLYTLCKDEDGTYLMMELYRSAEDVEAHGKTEHLKASQASFKGLMAGAPDIKKYEVVG